MIVGTIGQGPSRSWFEGVVFRPDSPDDNQEERLRVRAPGGGQAEIDAAMELEAFFAGFEGQRIRVTIEELPEPSSPGDDEAVQALLDALGVDLTADHE